MEEKRAEITFFLKYGEETKKVVSAVDSLATLHTIFLEKFPEASTEEINFLVKDRQFGVVHKVEVGDNEIYEGAVVEAKIAEKKSKRELEGDRKQPSEPDQGKRQKVAAAKPAYIRNLEDDGKRWVQLRGLPWEVTTEQIKTFFDGLNYIEDSIHILANTQGQATGDAFVQFVDDENLEKAEERNKNNIGSRYIEVYKVTQEIKDRAIARSRPWNPSGRDGVANGPVSPGSQVVKLRGLPYSATDSEVKEFLLQGLEASSILAIHMSSDHMGRASGDAYVECADDAALEQALKLNKKNMGRRYVDVMRSSVAEMTQAMAGRGGLVGGYAGILAAAAVAAAGHFQPQVSPNAFIVKMRGLPFSCTEQDIRDFFKDIHLMSITQTRDYLGRASGEAFVEVGSEDALAEAMKLNKQHMGRRYIDLFRSSEGVGQTRVVLMVKVCRLERLIHAV